MEKKQTLRLCIGCNEMKPKKELLRIVKNEEGISLDRTGKKNGRGAYICDDKSCLEKAIKNRGLERSFKQKIDKEIYEALISALENGNE